MREFYENEWFPKANAIGVSWQEFWRMNPHIINLLLKGHEEKRENRMQEQDILNWYLGRYFASALDCTVCNNTLWRKKNSKPHGYVEKPFLQEKEGKQQEEISKELTEEEKKKQTEQLFLKLRIMGANFNLNHSKDGTGS